MKCRASWIRGPVHSFVESSQTKCLVLRICKPTTEQIVFYILLEHSFPKRSRWTKEDKKLYRVGGGVHAVRIRVFVCVCLCAQCFGVCKRVTSLSPVRYCWYEACVCVCMLASSVSYFSFVSALHCIVLYTLCLFSCFRLSFLFFVRFVRRARTTFHIRIQHSTNTCVYDMYNVCVHKQAYLTLCTRFLSLIGFVLGIG